MTPEETGQLLATCATFDNRKTGPLDVIAWHRVLGDLPYRDSENAVLAHYAETAERIMPAHIRQRVREVRQMRVQDAEIPAPPSDTLDDPAAYCRALRAAETAVADGRDPLAAMAAVTARGRRELEGPRD